MSFGVCVCKFFGGYCLTSVRVGPRLDHGQAIILTAGSSLTSMSVGECFLITLRQGTYFVGFSSVWFLYLGLGPAL